MAELLFNTGNTLKQSLRVAPSKYDRSKLRYNFEQSEGQRVAEVWYAHKFLPVQFRDTNTEDYVVIPKGKAVSALGVGEHIVNTAGGSLGWPHASGSIPVFQDRSASTVTTAVDGTFWGYNETVNGLLVPANGGQDRVTADSYEYSSMDVAAGTYKSNSALAVAGDDVTGLLASGNISIGAAMYDIYADIRGKNLNYGMWDKWGIVQDWFVTVPFVREEATIAAFNTALALEATPDDNAVADALRDLTYMTIPSGYVPRTGATIAPDVRGNYTLQDPFDTIADVAGSTAAANPTVQTVGRLITLDSRFPKDMLQYVDTYEGSQMAGTDTAGLPYWLFIFVYKYILATTGTAPTLAEGVNYVKDGRFGMARFNLHVN